MVVCLVFCRNQDFVFGGDQFVPHVFFLAIFFGIFLARFFSNKFPHFTKISQILQFSLAILCFLLGTVFFFFTSNFEK